ncbi:GNAT family N-acetyltransferase [Flavobacterium sp.]|uniref:GNAT family N-acetyltransferase n=1 Tax=Flavobacterium sp. TaxID=239 RepID=UPI00262BCB11|nr:GNAT family N-acetyltransferase [Flavobacterium sp.]MDG2432140.1 GNAT family N-acetyltransferase [Flavobacterium sp.]
MITIVRTTADNPDFIHLIQALDRDIAIRDGEEHTFYAQFNKTDHIKHVLVAYEDDQALGCGAFKLYQDATAEIKRMYVAPEGRGKGIATQILIHLQQWAAENHFTNCILETGQRYPEAIALYLKNGFEIGDNYGQYIGIKDSVCFQKKI